jgi:hypothetical protein
MNDGLTSSGLSVVCETCESDIDFPDDSTAETCVCRHCGMAFLIDAPAIRERSAEAG